MRDSKGACQHYHMPEKKMKEYITDFDQLYVAMVKCQKNVTWKPSVKSFVLNSEENLHRMETQLKTGTWKNGKPRHIQIKYPKKRDGLSIPFRDRVYQRSINDNSLYPKMSRKFVLANVACQKGKGTDYARAMIKKYLWNYFCNHGSEGGILQIDIHGYYPNMRHDKVAECFQKNVDPDTYEMSMDVLNSQYAGDIGYNPGSQMVQIAGISLPNDLDHFIKEKLHVKYYMPDTAMMECVNIYHQGGASALKRILEKTAKPYTADKIYETLCQDPKDPVQNQVGDYEKRQKAVIEMINTYADKDAESKGEVKMSKLQEFINLGNYYANSGGSKPYLEKRTEAFLDDFTKNAGSNNYTKFARDVDSWGQPGCQAQPWCAEYQFWKLVKTLGITKALQIMGGGFYNCQSITTHAKKAGTWHLTPKRGALVIFRKGSHVGSVSSLDSQRIYTNEGNTSSAAGVEANGGSVRNKSYAIGDSAIDGYVWIDWGEEKQAASTWKATGTATSTVNDLYIRETPNGYILGQINKGNRVEINGETSGKWTKVKVSGIGIGWAWTGYLTLDEKTGQKSEEIKNKQNKSERLFVGKISTSKADVRTWAGDEYPVIKKWPSLAKGNLIDVMNYTQKDKKGQNWYYVRIAGKYFGFVAAKSVSKA